MEGRGEAERQAWEAQVDEAVAGEEAAALLARRRRRRGRGTEVEEDRGDSGEGGEKSEETESERLPRPSKPRRRALLGQACVGVSTAASLAGPVLQKRGSEKREGEKVFFFEKKGREQRSFDFRSFSIVPSAAQFRPFLAYLSNHRT